MWCIRHQFLENITSRYTSFTSWRSLVRERKSAAIKRSWPDVVNYSEDPTIQDGSLFIEDALLNLDVEQENTKEKQEELEVASLLKSGDLSIFWFKMEEVAGCYPFENLRTAVDILFLCGSSDLVIAKQAIVSCVLLACRFMISVGCGNLKLCRILFLFPLICDSFFIICLIDIGGCLMKRGDTLWRTLRRPFILPGTHCWNL